MMSSLSRLASSALSALRGPDTSKLDENSPSFEYALGKAAMAGVGDTFVNHRADRAPLIVAWLFASGEDIARIASADLDPSLYGDPRVTGAIVAFLSRHRLTQLHVLHEAAIDAQHPLVAAIEAAGLASRLYLHEAMGRVLNPCVVVDQDKFRFQMRTGADAWIYSFQDPEQAHILINDIDGPPEPTPSIPF